MSQSAGSPASTSLPLDTGVLFSLLFSNIWHLLLSLVIEVDVSFSAIGADSLSQI